MHRRVGAVGRVDCAERTRMRIRHTRDVRCCLSALHCSMHPGELCVRPRLGPADQVRHTNARASDWLTLGFPVRALRSWWSVDGSWRVVTQPWLLALCSALAGLVDHFYDR